MYYLAQTICAYKKLHVKVLIPSILELLAEFPYTLLIYYNTPHIICLSLVAVIMFYFLLLWW